MRNKSRAGVNSSPVRPATSIHAGLEYVVAGDDIFSVRVDRCERDGLAVGVLLTGQSMSSLPASPGRIAEPEQDGG